VVYPGQVAPPESLLQTLIDKGQTSRSISSSDPTIVTKIDNSNPVEVGSALVKAQSALVLQDPPKRALPLKSKSNNHVLAYSGHFVDATVGRAIASIGSLEAWQASRSFDREQAV
jgi:hypothetical protein